MKENKEGEKEIFCNTVITLLKEKGFTEKKEPPFIKFQKENKVFEIEKSNGFVFFVDGSNDNHVTPYTIVSQDTCYNFLQTLD